VSFAFFLDRFIELLTPRRRVYVLDVIQQPQRARACGFGDKVSKSETELELVVGLSLDWNSHSV
jgi:hypothetical protein